MKKIALIFAGLLVSGAASALQFTESGPYKMTDCTNVDGDSVLNENVAISLSKNVYGGVACNNANSRIAIATCHSAGRTALRSVEQLVDPACDPATTTCATTIVETEGAAFPAASTKNGTVQSLYPSATCSASESEAQATTLATAP